jgi:hypothetical protein
MITSINTDPQNQHCAEPATFDTLPRTLISRDAPSAFCIYRLTDPETDSLTVKAPYRLPHENVGSCLSFTHFDDPALSSRMKSENFTTGFSRKSKWT